MRSGLMEAEQTRQEISTEEASQRSGLSRNHITHLLRQGKLEGKNYGQRVWGVYVDSLEKYLASPRKSGPKGPWKKGKQTSGIPSLSQNGHANGSID